MIYEEIQPNPLLADLVRHFWCFQNTSKNTLNYTVLPDVKAYANILRFLASYSHIQAGNLVPSGNFYDQSHFIKEIKKHAGVNPTALYQNENDRFLQFSTLGQK